MFEIVQLFAETELSKKLKIVTIVQKTYEYVQVHVVTGNLNQGNNVIVEDITDMMENVPNIVELLI